MFPQIVSATLLPSAVALKAAALLATNWEWMSLSHSSSHPFQPAEFLGLAYLWYRGSLNTRDTYESSPLFFPILRGMARSAQQRLITSIHSFHPAIRSHRIDPSISDLVHISVDCSTPNSKVGLRVNLSHRHHKR
jgi:hypothetical protein